VVSDRNETRPDQPVARDEAQADLIMNAIRRAEGSPQQALQLDNIQAVTANDASVEEEDRDVESVTTL
jgi:hypothetical protein